MTRAARAFPMSDAEWKRLRSEADRLQWLALQIEGHIEQRDFRRAYALAREAVSTACELESGIHGEVSE